MDINERDSYCMWYHLKVDDSGADLAQNIRANIKRCVEIKSESLGENI